MKGRALVEGARETCSTVRVTTLDDLAKAERIELFAAELYDNLAKRHPEGSKPRGVFGRLADEERQHALRIRMLADQFRRSPAAFSVLKLDAAELQSIAADMSSLLAKLRRAGGDASYESALQFAIAIEKRLASVHAECLIAASNPELANVFEQLARGDREHLATLGTLPCAPRKPPS